MRKQRTRIALALLLCACLFTGCGAGEETPAPTAPPAPEATAVPAEAGFSAELLSTGKSDCAIIFMDGLVVLSDTAEENDYNDIASRLKADGVNRIDYIILSHYDKDHIGSAARLIRNFEVGAVLRPDYVEESGEYYALVKAESAMGIEAVILTEDYAIRTENGLITVDPPDEDYGDDNNNSVVTTVTYRGHTLLFLGDARKKRMEEFLRSAPDSCDFIKLPHHGDGNKALYSLLRSCTPVWAAATVSGEDAVEPELAELLDRLGVVLYRTSDGPVRVFWDTDGLTAVRDPA